MIQQLCSVSSSLYIYLYRTLRGHPGFRFLRNMVIQTSRLLSFALQIETRLLDIIRIANTLRIRPYAELHDLYTIAIQSLYEINNSMYRIWSILNDHDKNPNNN